MNLLASDRFLKSYHKASLGLQNLVEGAVHDLIQRVRSDPKTLNQQYDWIRGLSQTVLEVDVSGANRMLAVYSENQIVLVAVGGHDLVPKYTDAKLVHDLDRLQEAPAHFWPEQGSKFFVSTPDRTVAFKYPEEITPDWIYFLAPTQEDIFFDVMTHLEDPDDNIPCFIIGGPGTGKTCILLNSLKYWVDEGKTVGIHMGGDLMSYAEKSNGADIRQFHVLLTRITRNLNLDILLVDDPDNMEQIAHALQLQAEGIVNSVVVAFDPLQLTHSLTDDAFNTMLADFGVQEYRLQECYRQKEHVGEATKHVVNIVADSTPFIREDKTEAYRAERQQLTSLSNNLVFINPHGYIEYYEQATLENWQTEIERILQADWMLWNHWAGLLVVTATPLPSSWKDALAPLYQRNYVAEISLDTLNDVKGMEYQHVFVVLDQEHFNEIQNGFSGTGRKVYNQRRLLRIPFSRAKDSLVTFGLSVQ